MSLGAVPCWEDGCDNFASLYGSGAAYGEMVIH